MKNTEFIYEYWNKTNLGREMIKSNRVSESDLLFLIPNNVKKIHGLPLTRISGRKKRKQKEQRKRLILSFNLFDIIENIIDETLCSESFNNEFFNKFVEIKSLNLGNKNYALRGEYHVIS